MPNNGNGSVMKLPTAWLLKAIELMLIAILVWFGTTLRSTQESLREHREATAGRDARADQVLLEVRDNLLSLERRMDRYERSQGWERDVILRMALRTGTPVDAGDVPARGR